LNAEGFEGWLRVYLLPSLSIPSVLIMDNAPIHRKNAIKELVKEAGHEVVFLPKHSPDLKGASQFITKYKYSWRRRD
jgi:transposase